MEFWGVWCGPCVRVMPHLSVLQKENPKVVFIGIDEFDELSAVQKFVSERSHEITYRLAYDGGLKGKLGPTGNAYMTALGETGFPGAFIV